MDKGNIENYIGLVMVVILPMIIYGFVLIDKLIRHLYEVFNDEWCKLGKPSGLMYFPPHSKNFKSMLSLQKNIFIWIFKTPAWIKNDTIALSLLKKIRWIVAVVNIAILILFGLIFISILGQIK